MPPPAKSIINFFFGYYNLPFQTASSFSSSLLLQQDQLYPWFSTSWRQQQQQQPSFEPVTSLHQARGQPGKLRRAGSQATQLGEKAVYSGKKTIFCPVLSL
jgi:hypothetical protein